MHHSNRPVALVCVQNETMKPVITMFLAVVQPPYF